MHGLDVIKRWMLCICTYAKCISMDSHLLLGISPYIIMMLVPQEHAEAAGNEFINS